MREILFRGKSYTDDKWHYGYYTFKPATAFTAERHEIVNDAGLGWNCPPSTIGQFTGLTDKNGKKIFEGDIVECWSEGVKARGEVRQRIDGLWILYPAFQSNVFWGLYPHGNGETTVEVIGTIHDKEAPT